jgi:hypothetical protein
MGPWCNDQARYSLVTHYLEPSPYLFLKHFFDLQAVLPAVPIGRTEQVKQRGLVVGEDSHRVIELRRMKKRSKHEAKPI